MEAWDVGGAGDIFGCVLADAQADFVDGADTNPADDFGFVCLMLNVESSVN